MINEHNAFRFLALLLCITLFPFWSYAEAFDFTLTFSSPEAVPGSKVEGVVELLDMLTISGTAILADRIKEDGFDLTASAILEDDEKTRVDLKLYGLPALLHAESPVWNNEPILLNMPALLEYAMKIYNHMDIPLQRIALLYPYATTQVLESLWNDLKNQVQGDQELAENASSDWTLSAERVLEIGNSLAERSYSDREFRIWLETMGSINDAGACLTDLFESMPDYLEETIPGMKISKTVDGMVWQIDNEEGTILFSEQRNQDRYTAHAFLPEWIDGTDASLDYACVLHENTYDVTLSFSLGEDDACLLAAEILSRDLPCQLPVNTPFSIQADFRGTMLDTLSWMKLNSDHLLQEISLSDALHLSMEGDAEGIHILDEGEPLLELHTATRVIDQYEEPHHTIYELYGLNFFSLYDSTLHDFLTGIQDSLLKTAIPIVIHAPVSTVVTLMDILQDGGVLDLLAYGIETDSDEMDFEMDEYDDAAYEDTEDDFPWD